MTDTKDRLAETLRADIRRCLDDVATEFRARGRNDTRFVQLIARIDALHGAQRAESAGNVSGWRSGPNGERIWTVIPTFGEPFDVVRYAPESQRAESGAGVPIRPIPARAARLRAGNNMTDTKDQLAEALIDAGKRMETLCFNVATAFKPTDGSLAFQQSFRDSATQCREQWRQALAAYDAQRVESEGAADKTLLDAIASNYWKLEPIESRTPGGDDADVYWRVSDFYRAEPRERVVAESFRDDPRAAIREAIKAATPEKDHG